VATDESADGVPLVLRALVIGWALTYVSGWILGPFEYSILAPLLENRYSVIPVGVVGLLIGGPLCVSIGWIVGKCARKCRIPAVLGFAMSFLLLGLISNIKLMILEGASLEQLSLFLWGMAPLTILILFGGGLLTGSPKRSIPTH
jgi:hypothetical protein